MNDRSLPTRLRAASILAIAACLLILPPTAHAAPAPPPTPLSPAGAQQLLSVLNDPAKLADLKTTLTNLSQAVAATPPAKPPLGLPQNSLAAQLVETLNSFGAGLAGQGRDVLQTLHVFGAAGPWAKTILADPARRSQIAAAFIRLTLVIVAAIGLSALLALATRRPAAALARLAESHRPPPQDADADAAPERARHSLGFARILHALQLLPLALAHLILQFVPIAGFALVAFLAEACGLVQSRQNLVVIQSAVLAFVIGGAFLAATRFLLAPAQPALRLLPVGDAVARRISFWLRLMVITGASGFAVLNLLQSFGLPDYAASVAQKLLLFALHSMLAVLIFRSRHDIAGSLTPRHSSAGPSWIILRAIATNIWIIAIFFDFALWLIWAAQLKNGYARLLTSTAETALAIALGRLLTVAAFGGLERLFRTGANPAAPRPWTLRAGQYYQVARRFALSVVTIGVVVAVLQAWGLHAFHWFRAGAIGGRLLSASAGALLALIVGIIIWEASNIALEQQIDRLQHNPAGGAARVARLRTLMPILRIVLFIFIAVVLVMTVLSEIGVDIAPLLGGAGILGVAIGFGSQKLVQDFITGIFLLLENAMQVGDSVTCAGLSGSVEHLSIRTLHLRAGDGSLLIIPFSSVTTIANSNRGLGNAPISIDIAPDEDPDRVAAMLKQIVTEMKADPEFGPGMLSELQYWGVDKVTTQAVTLVGQIVCTDASHDGVRREFNRRMRKSFADHGINLAKPVQEVQLLQARDSQGALTPSHPP